MSSLSTHVLDTASGRPAAGVPVRLAVRDGAGWRELADATTDADGRVTRLLPAGEALATATYRLTFDVQTYRGSAATAFFPEVTIVFAVSEPERHHHVPLLLAPFGYSTYRGS
jgi:5-hydroxyisourate hydrolase